MSVPAPPSDAVLAEGLVIGHGSGSDAFRLEVGTLRLGPGQTAAFVGPSGCGKTSLLHAITGVSAPIEGRVALLGTELGSLGVDARRRLRIQRVGMVFQSFALVDHLTALENILLPFRLSPDLRLDGQARERADELAGAAGITHVLRRTPRRLSHGERQRVAVCRALVTQPALLACDEPTGNLDPVRAAAVMDLILGEARRAGAAVLCVTHDRSLLDRFERVIDLGELARARGGEAA